MGDMRGNIVDLADFMENAAPKQKMTPRVRRNLKEAQLKTVCTQMKIIERRLSSYQDCRRRLVKDSKGNPVDVVTAAWLAKNEQIARGEKVRGELYRRIIQAEDTCLEPQVLDLFISSVSMIPHLDELRG